MPATTRSAAKYANTDDAKASEVTGSKRKNSPKHSYPQNKAAKKKHVQDSESSESVKSTDSSIIINRAPVLQLWAATMTSFLYPDISWETSLSAGSAISTLCAISKGRAIGTIEKPESSAEDQKREKPRQRAQSDQLDELEVMGFHLSVKIGQVLVGGKAKKADKAALLKKFGEKEYGTAKLCFEEALESWKWREEELNAQAFHQYEKFRPTVPKGQKGWGRKGVLNLQTVKAAVARE